MAVKRENIIVWHRDKVWEVVGEDREGHHAKEHKCFKELQIPIPNSHLGHRSAAQGLDFYLSWCQRWVQNLDFAVICTLLGKMTDLPLRPLHTLSTGHGHQRLLSWPSVLCHVVINFPYNRSNNYDNPSRQVQSLLLWLGRMLSTLVMCLRPLTWEIPEVQLHSHMEVSFQALSTLNFSWGHFSLPWAHPPPLSTLPPLRLSFSSLSTGT